VLSSCQNWRILPRRNGYVPSSGLQWFNIEFLAGTPPSEYQKILAVAPSVANATGGGYAAALNRDLLSGGPLSWGPPDNTLGKLFAGITTTTDGGCQDMSDFGNAYLGSGLPMLAASNCPPSWPDGVWKGDHPIEESAYKTLFDQQGATFSFKYWQIPESLKRVDKPFLGTNFSSYGESTDHYKEILEAYGSVIPGGVGAPAIQGYPLGIVWHWEVFNFGLPSALNVSFYRATIINRSEDVYGVGIDYDSLYFGFMPGTGGTGAGGGQRYSDYWLPQNGVGLYHQSWSAGANGPCSEGSRVPAGGLGCGSGAAVSDMGYNNGGNAIIVLKSPQGHRRAVRGRSGCVLRSRAPTPGRHDHVQPRAPVRLRRLRRQHVERQQPPRLRVALLDRGQRDGWPRAREPVDCRSVADVPQQAVSVSRR
jgi:hypothetical protein